MRFKNKIALVTGAESGIGAKVVQTLLSGAMLELGKVALLKKLQM